MIQRFFVLIFCLSTAAAAAATERDAATHAAQIHADGRIEIVRLDYDREGTLAALASSTNPFAARAAANIREARVVPV